MSGPTAREESWALPGINPRFVLKLLGVFLVSLGLWYLLRYPYSRAVLFVSAPLLRVVEDAEEVLRVEGERIELVTKLEPRGGGPRRTLELTPAETYDGFRDLIIFVSLVLLTPLSRLRARGLRLIAGAALVFACHVAFFTLAMFLRLEASYVEVGLARRSGTVMYVAAGAAHIYSTVLSLILPFVAIAPVWLGRGPRRDDKEKAGRKIAARDGVGRNDPCPCGSGKKLKHCCGR